jgi:hypothetical protein
MAQYNLTDNTKDSFTFQLGELEYSFRYPTTAELREIGQLNAELQKLIDDKASEEEVTAKSKESEDKMNALVTPVGHDNSISEVLEVQPINVVRNFRQMMAKEISLG